MLLRSQESNAERGWGARQLLPWVAVGAGMLLVLAHNFTITRDWMVDDAFITFRYAEHLAAGQGPVYNPGRPPVEGYTTFLWVALLAGGKVLGFDVVLLSRYLGVLFGVGCLVLTAHMHVFVKAFSQRLSVCATLFLASCGVFLPWLSSGMEVTCFAFLMLLALLWHFRQLEGGASGRQAFGLGLLCAAMAMARPEGLLAFGLLFLDSLQDGYRHGHRRFLFLAAGFSLIYAPYFAWRWMYYGYLLPNTFYAKVGTRMSQALRGVEYLRDWARPALLLIVFAAAAVILPFIWWTRYRRYSVLPLFFVLYTGYVVLVGGDPMPAYRFFGPVMPLLCVIAAAGGAGVSRRGWAAAVLAIIVIGYNVEEMYRDYQLNERIQRYAVSREGTVVGKWLKEHARPGAVLATNTAGTIPYYSGLETIDMLGLNDAVIAHRLIPYMGDRKAAHEKGDGRYVLSCKPDYIQLGGARGSADARYLSDKELQLLSAFNLDYRLKRYPMQGGFTLTIYEREETRQNRALKARQKTLELLRSLPQLDENGKLKNVFGELSIFRQRK